MSARFKGNAESICSISSVWFIWLFFSNQTNETNQKNQRNKPALVVDFSTGWWIATMSSCIPSRQDTSVLENMGHFRMAMLARALRFTCDKHR
jgi:hypothetical protein